MNNVKLLYHGNVPKVKLAVAKANEILGSVEFYQQITGYRQFDNSALSPEVIARLLRESDYSITVKVNWWLADIRPRTSDRIIISGWDFSSNIAAGVNLLISETVNAIDKIYDITQNDISLSGLRRTSAPLVIGAIAEVMAK